MALLIWFLFGIATGLLIAFGIVGYFTTKRKTNEKQIF